MSAPTAASSRRARLLRLGGILAALVALYAALGFLAAPALLRDVLVKEASAALHRDVTIAKVRVNPFALSVQVEGLAVKHRDGAPFVSWDALYVRLAPLRFLVGDVGLAEIRLVRPSVHVGLDAKGDLVFQDLLAPDAKPPAAEPAKKKEGGLSLSIGRLAVEEARVSFHDASRRPAFDTTLGPVTIRLESFRTRGGGDSPYALSGTTEAGETFRWTGTIASQPFRSTGTLAFEHVALPRYGAYLEDAAPVELHDGRLDFETRYELEWAPARRVVRLSGGKVRVERLAVGPRGARTPPVDLPRIEVSGIDVDALARVAKVGEVAVRGGAVRVLREADGRLELLRMEPPPSPRKSPPWHWSIGAVAVSGLALDVEDRTAPRPVVLPLTDVQLRLEQLRDAVEATSPLALSLTWNGRGRLAVKGAVKPLGNVGTLAIDASDLDLAPLAPYLATSLAARLTGGRAGARLQCTYDAAGATARWSAKGDVRVDALAVAERGNDDLLRWTALEITGIDAASTPPRASVQRIRLVEPRVKAYVWEDGTTSVARATAAPAGGAKAPARSSAAGPAWRTAIGAVEIVRGRATLVDRSIRPAAVVNLGPAEAKVTNLSSDPRVRSAVDVRVEVEGTSPVRIAGTLNPLQKEAYTDLTVASDGVDLTPLGTYSGKFLGYGIQKGKLNLDLRYKIQNRNLAATNVVKVDQFTLGESTHSPDATKIPVRLALALLQDTDGVILLDVPVEGNLDDPEFRLGRVIWHTILNVLGKVATSPFRALAALAGGPDADLSLVEFTPGTSEPVPASRDQLAMLAKSLAQRPALGLELEGSADPEHDGPALRRAALERALRHAKAATLRPPAASEDEVTLTPDERARLVRAAYEAAFPAAGAGEKTAKASAPAAPPPPAEMEERLAATMEVPPDAYRALAAERARRAREALVATGLDQARLFLTEGGERAQKEKGARVYFNAR